MANTDITAFHNFFLHTMHMEETMIRTAVWFRWFLFWRSLTTDPRFAARDIRVVVSGRRRFCHSCHPPTQDHSSRYTAVSTPIEYHRPPYWYSTTESCGLVGLLLILASRRLSRFVCPRQSISQMASLLLKRGGCCWIFHFRRHNQNDTNPAIGVPSYCLSILLC